MTVCVYCLDNDIILKLATYSLFDQTLKTFEIDSSKVKILGLTQKIVKYAIDSGMRWEHILRLVSLRKS